MGREGGLFLHLRGPSRERKEEKEMGGKRNEEEHPEGAANHLPIFTGLSFRPPYLLRSNGAVGGVGGGVGVSSLTCG